MSNLKVEIIPFIQTPGGSKLPAGFFSESDAQLAKQELAPLEREIVTVFRALAEGAKGIGSLRHSEYEVSGANDSGTVTIVVRKKSPSLGL